MTRREKIISVLVLLMVVTMIQLPPIITAAIPAANIRKLDIELQKRRYEEQIQKLKEEIHRLNRECGDPNEGR